MTITELRKKRASVWESAKAFLNSHRQENGLLSAEDDATYSTMCWNPTGDDCQIRG